MANLIETRETLFQIATWFKHTDLSNKISFNLKMKPLQTNKMALTWLCVCPADVNTSIWKRLAYLAFTLLTIAFVFSSVVASVAFFVKFVSVSLEMALNAVWQIGALSSLLYFLAVAYGIRRKINGIFESLEKIYLAGRQIYSRTFQLRAFLSKSSLSNFQQNSKMFNKIPTFSTKFQNFRPNSDEKRETFRFLVRTNNKCEWMWQLFFKIIISSILFEIVLCTVALVICYINHGSFNTEYLLVPFKLV